MRILVVAATESEVSLLISDFGFSPPAGGSISDLKETEGVRSFYSKSEIIDPNPGTANPTSDPPTGGRNCKLEILITGVGMVATAFALGRHLAVNQYDLIINLGICGSFDKRIALGEILEITKDTFAELGAEDDQKFLSIEAMEFGEATFYPTAKTADINALLSTINLSTATAITVNTVHGNETTIKNVTGRLNPQLESMEGAAFFYACRENNVACLQIRAVSNYVEKRNKDNWNISLAIKNLNTFAIQFIKLCLAGKQ